MHSIIIHLFFCLLGLSGSLFTPVLAADSTASPPLQCPAQPGLGPACAAADSPWLLALAGNPINLIKDRKSTRLNSSHVAISYAVFCLKKNNHLSTRTDDSGASATNGGDDGSSVHASRPLS